MGPTFVIFGAPCSASSSWPALGFVFAGGPTIPGNARQARPGDRRRPAAAATAGACAAASPANADTRRKQIVKTLKEQERQQKKARLTLASKLQQAGLAPAPMQF